MTERCRNCGDTLDPDGDYGTMDGVTVCDRCLKGLV